MTKNAVERSLEVLRDLWLTATEEKHVRLVVWRIPQSSGRLLGAFFEAQKHPGAWSVPDLMLPVAAPFETGFNYSRLLREEIQERYKANQETMQEEGLPANWYDAISKGTDSPAGVLALCQSFVRWHRQYLRNLVLVLEPVRVVAQDAFAHWLETLADTPIPAGVIVALVDTVEAPSWQALVERSGKTARVIDVPLDMFDIARELAAQGGGSGPQVAHRQMLTELMTLVERGSASRLEQRAERALALAERQQWPDQQVTIHMMVAGGWLKERQFDRSIAAYRQARECAKKAQAAQHPAANDLLMQTWFGEASAWFAAGQLEAAAKAYELGAQAATCIPNAIFAIEGHRMAAHCHGATGQREKAMEQGFAAIRAAHALPPSERPMTTLPLVLDDLMKRQDEKRTRSLAELADAYQESCQRQHAEAESAAEKLGSHPDAKAIAGIEKKLHEGLEAAFHHTARERELLIQKGDVFFRKLVAIGRDFLHPQWNGLPDIQHPLDHEISAWSEPPASQPLPEPGDLHPETIGETV